MSQNQESQNQEKPGKLLEMREEEKKPLFSDQAKKDKIKKEVREWIISIAAAVVAVLIIRTFLFSIIRVDGPSMQDTLHNGDRLYVDVLSMRLNGPERFDVVILHYPGRSENFVKRVIGLPGDTLEVREGVLYVNGEATPEEFLSDERTVRFDKSTNNIAPFTVPDGQYFVMGDNRDNSNDSRSVGFIDKDMFVGKVRFILWPLDRIGGVAGSEVYDQ